MTEFKWTISAFDRKPDNKIITSIHWRLSAIRDGIDVETYGCTPLPEPTGVIIDYDLITKEQVVIWLESIMSIIPESIDDEIQQSQLYTIKQSLEKSIDEKLNPISETTVPNFI